MEATDDNHRRQKLGKQARDAAVAFILDKYRDEFETQVEKERLQRGLLRKANAKSPEQLEEQLKKIQAKAAAIEKELKATRRARQSVTT